MSVPIVLCTLLVAAVAAQNVSLSLSTSLLTVTVPSSARQPPLTTVIPELINVTYTITSSTSHLPSPTPSPTPSATPSPFVLATSVDPAFAVLGVILILTGLPSAFWGHKNRWTSFFLIGFYSLALVCIVLILKFGVLSAINPPSKTLRGMFVLASTIAGIAGGAIAIFFWKGARYGIGAWGGFALALWIQCFHNGGLIKSIGFRWILYIGCGVVGFALSTIPKIHYHALLISTAFVGATSFILGVDCFTTAGLKEFYVWNLGFTSLFPKFVKNHIQFPVSQTMQIELGLIGAVALMGIAVQLRILKVLQKKLEEIAEEARKRDEEAELRASDRLTSIEQERDNWEKDHPSLSKHGRQDSALSSMPLMKDIESTSSPIADHPPSFHQEERRPRHRSSLSDFKVAPTSDEELKRASRYNNNNQNPGTLPALDLGLGIQEDVPSSFIANEVLSQQVSAVELEDFKRKQELLAEIQTIRRSIDILKTETPIPSSSEQSRRPSFASRRTLSADAGNVLQPVWHARPPRETAPRARVHSMELLSLARNSSSNDPISRPTSVPLRDDWDSYIQERRLLQPPTGVTPPIPTTPRGPLSPAVQEALQRRKRRESALGAVAPSSDSSEDVPLARIIEQKLPVTILPPRRSALIAAPVAQAATRTRTFEELNERHREKMRDMQGPLTQAEKEHAELEAARQRWERSKALEKEAVTRRQAEKAAAVEKRKKGETEQRQRRHSHGDRLQGASRRLSTLKVEDWQRYQSTGIPFPDS